MKTISFLKATLLGFIVAIGASASLSFASGIFTLKGKIRGATETEYLISTKTLIYEIKKSGLSESQLAFLKEKKSGQEIELTIATDAVVKVREASSQKSAAN